jgi:hypothetical protein
MDRDVFQEATFMVLAHDVGPFVRRIPLQHFPLFSPCGRQRIARKKEKTVLKTTFVSLGRIVRLMR